MQDRKLIEIKEENYNNYKEFIILIIEEESSSEFIFKRLNENNQENLIEKTTCTLCNEPLNEKPYYCYNCNKIFCSKCFEDERAFKRLEKMKCDKCGKESKYNKVICDNCNIDSKNEYIECTYCKFCLDKSNWRRLRDYDRNREYLENKENLKKEIILLLYEYKYNKIDKENEENKRIIKKLKDNESENKKLKEEKEKINENLKKVNEEFEKIKIDKENLKKKTVI